MFNLSDTHHFRKLVAGVCMVFAPLFLLASTIMSPALDLTSIGRMVMSETDEEWEHTPEFRGFRPVAGAS